MITLVSLRPSVTIHSFSSIRYGPKTAKSKQWLASFACKTFKRDIIHIALELCWVTIAWSSLNTSLIQDHDFIIYSDLRANVCACSENIGTTLNDLPPFMQFLSCDYFNEYILILYCITYSTSIAFW